MNEKLAKKLEKILAKAGLDEDKIGEIIEEVEGAVAEEGAPEETNPDDEPNPPIEDIPGEGEPKPDEGEGEQEVVPPLPTQEGEPEPTNPGDGSIEDALNQLAEQEGEGAPLPPEVPGEVVPPTPEIPPIDPQVVTELSNQLQEANKTIDALQTKIDSLYEALKEAGVISGDAQVGDETPRITPNANAGQEDAFDDILSVINGR